MDSEKNNNNIFYWIKKHKLLTICLAIIIYIVIPIIPFIQSPIGIFSKEDATLFLSYYGTIISGITGGALTLGGVWWTINVQNDQRKEDLAIQYKPYITINILDDIRYSLCSENGKNYLKVIASNIGRGEALNCKCYLQNSDNCFGTVSDFSPTQERQMLIPFNGAIDDSKQTHTTITISVTYTDFLKINKYELIAEFDITFTLTTVNNIEYSLDYK